MMLSSLAALEIDELESAAVPDCVRMLKEVYGEPFLLQAEKYSDKSLFRRLREKTTKLLVKTERPGPPASVRKKLRRCMK